MFFKLIYYYNIKFPYKIRKVVEIFYVLNHEGKKSWNGDGLIEIIRGG